MREFWDGRTLLTTDIIVDHILKQLGLPEEIVVDKRLIAGPVELFGGAGYRTGFKAGAASRPAVKDVLEAHTDSFRAGWRAREDLDEEIDLRKGQEE